MRRARRREQCVAAHLPTMQYPKLRVCAAHVAPVFLDTPATIAKACALISESANTGARLIAFPESFVPGFPVWAGVQAPIENHDYFRRLAASSIEVPGPETQQIWVGENRITNMSREHFDPILTDISNVSM